MQTLIKMRQAIVKYPLWTAYKHKRHMIPLVIPLLGCRFMFLGTSGRVLLAKIWRTKEITCKINHWQTFVTSENHWKRPKSDEEAGEVLKPPIKVSLVQVFDPRGLFIGKMPITKARKFAEDRKMILFQMKSTVDDPNINQRLACYKMITSEDLLEERKKDKQSKSKEKSEKVFVIKDKITDHDLSVKVNKIKQELEDGYEVKITIKATGSQEQEGNLMNKVFKKINDDTKDIAILSKAGADLATEIKFVLKRKEEKQEQAVDV